MGAMDGIGGRMPKRAKSLRVSLPLCLGIFDLGILPLLCDYFFRRRRPRYHDRVALAGEREGELAYRGGCAYNTTARVSTLAIRWHRV